jgi:hypothetical protein
MRLWLKADAGVTTSGGLVSVWADQSGQGNDLVQGDSASQPTLLTGSLNGLPVIHFDGTSDHLVRSAPTFLDDTAGSAFLVYRFWDFGPTDAAQTFLAVDQAGVPLSAGHRYLLSIRTDDTGGSFAAMQTTLVNGPGSYGAMNTSGSFVSDGSPGTISVVAGNSDTLLYRNGVPNYWGAWGPLAGSMPGSWFGAAPDVSNVTLGALSGDTAVGFLAADLAEVILYDRALGSLERWNVEKYLANRYGLPEPPEPPTKQFLGAYSAAAAGQIERADGQGPGWTEAIGAAPDGLWGQSPILNRNYNFDPASYPAGKEILQSDGRDGEDCPVMDWTVPVSKPGTYDVWVRFGAIDNNEAFAASYGIYAGLESAENLTFYTGSSPGFENVSADPYHRDGRIYLGQATATDSFHLFFDDMGVLDPGFGIDPRIFGIETQFAPEPSVFAVLLAGGLALVGRGLRRRRSKSCR